MRGALARGAASLLAVAAVACSGGSTPPGAGTAEPSATTTEPTTEPTAEPAMVLDTNERVGDSLAATAESGTGRLSFSLVFDAGPLEADEQGEGVVEFGGSDAAWSYDMSRNPVGLVPEGTPPDQAVLRVREIGDDLFVSLPVAFAAAGIAGDWLRVDAVPPPEAESGLEAFGSLSPRVALAARLGRPAVALTLVAGASEAHDAGPASVRGKPTTRYSIAVSLRAMLEEAGLMFFFGAPTDPERLAVLDRVFGEAATCDVFLDELGRIRKVLVVGDLGLVAPYFDPPGDPEIWRELRLEWEFFDYGVDVVIEAPTARVVD